MRKCIMYLCLAVPLIYQSGHAQTIGLDEFLESIERSHPFFVKEELATDIALKDQESYLGTEDWTITSSPYYVYQEPAPWYVNEAMHDHYDEILEMFRDFSWEKASAKIRQKEKEYEKDPEKKKKFENLKR